MTAREEHIAAVEAVRRKAEEIQEMIGAAGDAAREMIGMAENAVGGAETDAAIMLLQSCRSLEQEIVNEPARLCEVVLAECERYGAGF